MSWTPFCTGSKMCGGYDAAEHDRPKVALEQIPDHLDEARELLVCAKDVSSPAMDGWEALKGTKVSNLIGPTSSGR
jgi:hypothetical protein